MEWYELAEKDIESRYAAGEIGYTQYRDEILALIAEYKEYSRNID